MFTVSLIVRCGSTTRVQAVIAAATKLRSAVVALAFRPAAQTPLLRASAPLLCPSCRYTTTHATELRAAFKLHTARSKTAATKTGAFNRLDRWTIDNRSPSSATTQFTAIVISRCLL
jgi:hypothetical protein